MFLIRRLLSTVSQNVSAFEHNLMRDVRLRKEMNEIMIKIKEKEALHNYFRKCDVSNNTLQLKNNTSSK